MLRAVRTTKMPEDRDFDLRSLYIQHGPAVFGVAAKICSRDHAADVTQEVFTELWQNPGRFHPERGSMRSYLLTIAHHKAVDLVRSGVARTGRERRVSAETLAPYEDIEFDSFAQEHANRLASALMTLPAGQRDAIVTAFYGQCTYREAALVLGQPEGTTKTRIRMGLMQLRTSLTTEAFR
jgi:RNA polymerase sigma-70 factor (ECF subfamily)